MVAKEGNNKKYGADGSRIRSIMKAAMRLLIKVKNFYADALIGCSSQVDYGLDLTGQVPATLPQSWSVNSSKSSSRRVDHNGMPRAGSTKSFAGQRGTRQMVRESTTEFVPRSQSVGMGKIDEEQECEFGDELVVNAYACPRSRSYAL